MATFSYTIGYDESSLVRRFKANDELAYFEFFKAYSKKIFSLAYRMLGEEAEAEDAVQETFLNMVRGIKSFRGESKLSTWINRIAINVCLGMLRKNKQDQCTDLDSALQSKQGSIACSTHPQNSTKRTGATLGEFDPFACCLTKEVKAQVKDILKRLDDKHRLVVKLHDLRGLTIEEIAKALSCPPGTVKSRLFYGRRVFREMFNGRYRTN